MESDNSIFEEIARYVRFGPDDRDALRAFAPQARPAVGAIAELFYARIAEHDGARQVLERHSTRDRLKATFGDWLDSLLAGPWDASYHQRRAQIGRTHVRVGLPQRYMLTAMSVVRSELTALAERTVVDGPARRATVRALSVILDLDLAVMLEAYRDDYVARVQRLERRDKDQLERRLAITEARYMAVIENAAALVVATDDHHRVVLFNQTAETVTGYDRGDILGADWFETLCTPDSATALRAAVDSAMRARSRRPWTPPSAPAAASRARSGGT